MMEYLKAMLEDALRRLNFPVEEAVQLEKPRSPDHGDLTTNVALLLGKQLKRNPRELAEQIRNHLTIDAAQIERVEVAGPGFINFRFTTAFYQEQLRRLLEQQERFGRSDLGKGRKTQVEFVSANPTGPLTVGHGRGAVFGDTVSRLLEWTGHEVTREYYFNNAGRQMRILGDSVRLRYLELLGEQIEFPGDYYQGEYIRDIARHLKEESGDALRTEGPEGLFKERAEQEIFADIRQTLRNLGVEFQSYFNENSLYKEGKITEVIGDLRARGAVYDSNGALWFKASTFGGEKDKVIVKSTGEPTYRLPDIAYHREKFRRGYDLMIDVFGADHVATYPDVLAGLRALGLDADKVKVLIHQFVTIVQNGEVVKMSTRKANFVTLDELIAEVGRDVVRYFFVMRSIGSHLNFDLRLAKEQSEENPVYYLQYAHARICSILRFAESEGRTDEGVVRFDLLKMPEEADLMKALLEFPGVMESCAITFEPHRLTEYLHDVAGIFHRFYHVSRVVTEDTELTKARLALCRATKIVLKNGLSVLGISAPVQM
jgi:arginyl-tRNA synthetase